MRLQGKVALVVGGGMGMGKAVATAFAREGAEVAVADIDADAGSAAVDALVQSGADALFIRTDIADPAQVEAAVAETVGRFGRIDVLHVNAGIQSRMQDKRAHELSVEFWERTMAVNLRGSWLCCKYVIPHMLAQGGGSIILIGSPTGWLGVAPGSTAYSASKGGVIGLARVMAADYARDGIRVNSILPGTMDTNMIREWTRDPAMAQQLAEAIPLGRIGQPEDVAGFAVFLASDESAFCTGGLYAVDGGQSAI
jgi:NAD(P)-dependent dehydrogenase (short-subunit alcohol dehydrogenase family)